MLIYNGQIIAGGGTIVLPMTRAEYEANKAILDSADVRVDLTDEPDQIATAEQIAYSVGGVQKGMGYIGDITTKAVAKVEPTDTALYLHEVGEGFINKDGNYCITDVQISVGGTITLGTNCHVVDGGISNLASQDITSQITALSGTIKVYKSGKVVMVSWDIENSTLPTGRTTIATNLPIPCTPASIVGGSSPTSILWNAGGNAECLPNVVFTVDSNGALNVYNGYGSISGNYKGTHLMYICQ